MKPRWKTGNSFVVFIDIGMSQSDFFRNLAMPSRAILFVVIANGRNKSPDWNSFFDMNFILRFAVHTHTNVRELPTNAKWNYVYPFTDIEPDDREWNKSKKSKKQQTALTMCSTLCKNRKPKPKKKRNENDWLCLVDFISIGIAFDFFCLYAAANSQWKKWELNNIVQTRER